MTTRKPNLLCPDGRSARDLRRRLDLNQGEFWGRVGVTQSGGSRYEGGRNTPPQVLWALHLAYGTERQSQAFLTWLRREKSSQA